MEKEDRSARFRCALAICIPGQETKTVEGSVEGYITEEPRGTNGFGYDPVFLVKDKDQTMAEALKRRKEQNQPQSGSAEKAVRFIGSSVKEEGRS